MHTQPANIILGCMYQSATNTLAYYSAVLAASLACNYKTYGGVASSDKHSSLLQHGIFGEPCLRLVVTMTNTLAYYRMVLATTLACKYYKTKTTSDKHSTLLHL